MLLLALRRHFYQTINDITDAIKWGIQIKYDGVRDSTRQLKTKLLVRAMADFDELHEDKYGSPTLFFSTLALLSYSISGHTNTVA